MRILFFIETGGPGGAEQVVLQLAKGFEESGDQVGVVTLRTGWLTEQLAELGIKHYRLISDSSLDVSLPIRLSRILKNYDVLHSHLFDAGVYGCLAARLAARPHISTEHGDIHHINKRKFSGFKVFLLGKLASKCTAVSQYSKDALVAAGLACDKVDVVGNPIRLEQFRAASVSSVELGIPGVDDDTFVWVHVANHRKVKDQPTLIKGFASCCKASPRKQVLILVGDGPERAALEELVEQQGVSDRVFFMGFRNDVPDILAAADACVLSSRSEALPMSLLEAGARGLALVSSDVGGVRDIIRPNETGMLFESGDSQGLSEQLLKLLSDQELFERVSSGAKKFIEQNFSLEVVMKQYRALYEEFIR